MDSPFCVAFVWIGRMPFWRALFYLCQFYHEGRRLSTNYVVKESKFCMRGMRWRGYILPI
jgi:hypothetical protein